VRIYIGYDRSEHDAFRVACKTLSDYSDIEPEPIDIERISAAGLLNRVVDRRGQMYDLPSNAPCSTEFSVSRFLVPILCQRGWALFVDCDVVFMADPLDLMAYADPDKAVMVVKHNHIGAGEKMGGMVQTAYPKKNWSSVMMFNCDHPANRRLSIWDVNTRPGRDLHGLYWLNDAEVGEIPPEWNWLVNVQPMPDEPKIAHFTNGGPWISGWVSAPYDDIWLDADNG
jgi:lipopolysaccharide biosynthesis glycosyltransferase